MKNGKLKFVFGFASLLILVAGAPKAAAQVSGEGLYETPDVVVTGMDFEELTGCWAKIFDGPDFNGRSVTLVGYTAWSELSASDFPYWRGQVDSVQVGPNATLSLYGLPFFADEDHTVAAGVSVRNVSEVPAGDSLESLRLICNEEVLSE